MGAESLHIRRVGRAQNARCRFRLSLGDDADDQIDCVVLGNSQDLSLVKEHHRLHHVCFFVCNLPQLNFGIPIKKQRVTCVETKADPTIVGGADQSAATGANRRTSLQRNANVHAW
jgi:hypothetical protein